MKILIVGSKGFIGKHCRTYFAQKYETWGCDVVHDYVDDKYIAISAVNSDYSEIFNSNRFDVCINCSGAANVSDSLKNPQRDYELNVVNVFRMLDAIRKYSKNCKFINISSAAVYGNPVVLPIDEGQRLKPVSPYGLHKMHSEQICKEFNSFYHISTCSLRIFSAYGPGLQKQLLWDLYSKTLTTGEIKLFGTGKESRDFIHVVDIINTIDLVIEKSEFKGEAINVANGEELYIKDVVRIYYEQLGWYGRYTFTGESRAGDPINWRADISKIHSFGYRKMYPIERGIEDYVKWLKENI